MGGTGFDNHPSDWIGLGSENTKISWVRITLETACARNSIRSKKELINNFLLKYFDQISEEKALICFNQLLEFLNCEILAKLARKYSTKTSEKQLIQSFDDFKCYDGSFLYVDHKITDCKNSETSFKCTFAAAEVGKFKLSRFVTQIKAMM